jgi:hypothetical protein
MGSCLVDTNNLWHLRIELCIYHVKSAIATAPAWPIVCICNSYPHFVTHLAPIIVVGQLPPISFFAPGGEVPVAKIRLTS